MNTKHIALALLLALAPVTAYAQTTEPAPTSTEPTPAVTESTPPPSSTSSSTETSSSASSSSSSVSPPTFMISIRGGAFIPQIAANNLDASFIAGLGVGYVLPFLDYRVAVVVDAFYTMPQRSQTLNDMRLVSPTNPMGTYSYTMTQNDISMFVGFLVHFTDLARDFVVPYAGLGARIHFLWGDVDGTSGQSPLGFHRETSTQGGGAVRLGCGFRVGPGLIAVDAEVSLAPLDHIMTGNMNIGNLVVSAGYTLVL